MVLEFSSKHTLGLFLDLHGHSRKKNIFIYGCHDLINPYASREFPFLLSKLNKHFSFSDCNFSV